MTARGEHNALSTVNTYDSTIQFYKDTSLFLCYLSCDERALRNATAEMQFAVSMIVHQVVLGAFVKQVQWFVRGIQLLY